MIDVEQKIPVLAKIKKVIFADTDTLSTFLWRGQFGYFLKLFEKLQIEVIIPQVVLDELEYNKKTQERLAFPIKRLEKQGKLKILDIDVGSAEYYTYLQLTEDEGMGKGEAAALSMATHSECEACVASNNLSDISNYVRANNIDLWTTARIIRTCELENIMKKERAEELWKKMVEDGEWLPVENYNDYVNNLDMDEI